MIAPGTARDGPPLMVRVGDLRVANGISTLATVGVGSCVAVALYDAAARIGGLGHVLLPEPSYAREPRPAGRFASTAVDALLGLMVDSGAARRQVFARLVGGASMFSSLLKNDGRGLGRRNVEAMRQALEQAGIPVRGEEVGGAHGRSVYFRLSDGRLLITSIQHGDVVL